MKPCLSVGLHVVHTVDGLGTDSKKERDREKKSDNNDDNDSCPVLSPCKKAKQIS